MHNRLVLAPARLQEIEARWIDALAYFKSRGRVVFSSHCRFWESHGFVQQSLARTLASNGVEVIWLDGAGWRGYQPSVPNPLPLLKVRQMPQLPGRRIPLVAELNIEMQTRWLSKRLKRSAGAKPLIWIQAGIDERLAAELPYVDVFSVFDDPYGHTPMGDLCQKADLVLCQNSQAKRTLESMLADKVKLALPPLDLSQGVFDHAAELTLPDNFPKKIMGYVGSFFSSGYDLVLFENFITAFPEWGFVLMGRTDGGGMEYVERFKRYSNFVYVPWAPRERVAAAWKKIDLNLLFYRPNRTQDGAFPTKAVEALHFGVPSIATQVPKTENLEGFFPRSPFAERLKQSVSEPGLFDDEKNKEIYQNFAYEMNPKLHLARVAEWLRGKK